MRSPTTSKKGGRGVGWAQGSAWAGSWGWWACGAGPWAGRLLGLICIRLFLVESFHVALGRPQKLCMTAR